jgi:hypothetical protein
VPASLARLFYWLFEILVVNPCIFGSLIFACLPRNAGLTTGISKEPLRSIRLYLGNNPFLAYNRAMNTVLRAARTIYTRPGFYRSMSAQFVTTGIISTG